MLRSRTLATTSLVFAAACAADAPTPPDPAGPGTTPGATGDGRPASATEQAATRMGMTIMSANAAGVPRLMRALVRRSSAAAGMAPEQAARDHVAALAPLWGQKMPQMALVNTGVQRLRNNATFVKLAQEVDGTPVHEGELRVLMHADGSLAAVSGSLLPATTKPSFASSPAQVLETALDQLYGASRVRPAISELGATAGWQHLAVAADPGLRVSHARVRRELTWVGSQLEPVWAVEVLGAAAPDAQGNTGVIPAARRYLIADAGHRIVGDTNLIKADAFVYRAYAEPTGNRRPLDGALESFAPHPAGAPDGSAPGFAAQNLVVMEAFNGPHDKWLPDDATTTSGNNVDAFSDFNGNGTFDPGEIRPPVRAGRVLNFAHDPAVEPLSSADQLHAGTVNAFFLNNWMHDWWYDSGFTEATGNAQLDNFGRGGIAGDPLTLLAQFGAGLGSRNNAFMVTPADGLTPFMLMLLFNTGGDGPERDGDLDNTVVAHEWGHYLHLRLTTCDIGQQCGGMSEGWGDFNALMMMLREGDNRDGTYAMGGYALADGTPDIAYFGIRRFPYSLDRTKNALSFRHIADGTPLPTDTPGFPVGPNSEVHNAGEVWATMMWEAFNVLIDAHGVAVARRRMSDYVVAGLLLTPPEATFTEGRDAILAAASALDSDDMLLMAAAFAGRGAGSCAVGPSNSSPGNRGVVESGTLAGRLAISSVTIADDGVSCDRDGILDPGESGLLRLTVANTGAVAAEEVTVTGTPIPGVRFGTALRLAALQPFQSAELAIPVTLLPSAPRNTDITLTVQVAGDTTCEPAGIASAITVRIGVDEIRDAARIDTVEANQTPWTRTGALAEAIWDRTRDAGGNRSWLGLNAGVISDTQLVSPALQVSASEPFMLAFSHAFSLEGFPGVILFDGGVIELSTDGGATWADATAFGVDPGYSGVLASGGNNPLEGRPAFSGDSPGFPAPSRRVLDFGTQLAGQSVLVRFRIGTDINTAFDGWVIDDIEVSGTTNTPFTAVVTEPSTCTARKAASDDSSVIAVRDAPASSLDAFDAAVCIAGDAP